MRFLLSALVGVADGVIVTRDAEGAWDVQDPLPTPRLNDVSVVLDQRKAVVGYAVGERGVMARLGSVLP